MEKKAECYVRLGRIEKAKFIYQKALDSFPDNFNILFSLAQLYIVTLDFSAGEKISGKLETQGLNSPEFSILKADLSLIKDQKKAAEKFYREAIIGSKDSFRALMKLAIFLKSANREEEASEVFSIVQKNIISNPKILLLIADYYLLNNDYKNAEASIQNTIYLIF